MRKGLLFDFFLHWLVLVPGLEGAYIFSLGSVAEILWSLVGRTGMAESVGVRIVHPGS